VKEETRIIYTLKSFWNFGFEMYFTYSEKNVWKSCSRSSISKFLF